MISTALALVLAVGAWTSGLRGTLAPLMSHHMESAGGSGAGAGGDGLRNPTPWTPPRMIAGTAVIVGPLRLVHPPTTTLVQTPHQSFTRNRRFLDPSYSEHPHDQPHLHALPLLI